MPKLTRRSFLQRSLAAGAALSLPAKIYAQAPGSNSAIRIAVIGFNGRGNSHIAGFSGIEGVRIVGLCDADYGVLEKGKASLAKKDINVEGYTDVRKLLENKDIDAISTATPNHWHSLISIWGVQAGKDVYVEKPVSHNVFEGRKVVEAARKYGKICQTGTQSRSSIGLREAQKWVKAGNLGKIKWARGLCYKRRPSIGKVTEETPWPQTIDKDLWFGPAQIKPLMRTKLHYDWHWQWDYGNGDLGNQGIHQMDIARWFLNEPELSPSILSVGGRLSYIDDGETPNTQIIMHGYKAPLIFEVRGLPDKTDSKEMDKYRDASIGVIVQCENGYVVIPSYTGAGVFDNSGKLIKRFGSFKTPKGQTDPGGPEKTNKEDTHFSNFIDAVKSRKHTDLNADILEGHLSSALCHTGNISYRLGAKADQGAIREKLKADKEATDSLGRMIEHLAANGVDVKTDKLTLGEFLKMDPKTEKFVKNAAADKMLTRDYRKPYVVPEKV
ncbi:MAG: Gfo/Idh/MocA family oxidoreductase [Chthoniobacteraceae bacterium]